MTPRTTQGFNPSLRSRGQPACSADFGFIICSRILLHVESHHWPSDHWSDFSSILPAVGLYMDRVMGSFHECGPYPVFLSCLYREIIHTVTEILMAPSWQNQVFFPDYVSVMCSPVFVEVSRWMTKLRELSHSTEISHQKLCPQKCMVSC